MKKLLLLCTAIGLLWSACSNEFEIAAPFKDIPVVYGIISPNDTAHYIRIERVFIDPDSNAYNVARIADSIYYPANAIAVFLERVSNGQRYPMTRVDGNLEGYVRQSGTFSTNPNWLYKIKPAQLGGGLRGGEKYRLIIERTDGRPAVTAEATVPDTLLLIKPEPSTVVPRRINLSGSNPVVVEWRSRANAVIFDVYMDIRYREIDANGNSVNHSIRWKASKNNIREENLIGGNFYRGKANVSVNDFYNALLNNIDPVPDVQRYFNGIDIQIEGAGPEIAAFQESESINSGLTGAEATNSYSNLSEGFGIFTIKKRWSFDDFDLPGTAIDSLNANTDRRTKLKFKG